jgi:prepilin-type N-terminal cleavage/methylation domain-containing protein
MTARARSLPAGARARRASRRRGGFTLIEVMVSLGIMTVGALGMLALEQHTIRSNAHARQLTMAMQIAQLWVERLKQDASRWTIAGATPGGPNDATVLASTRFLGQIAAKPDQFQTILNPTATLSNAFDYQGNDVDVAANAANVFYCASFRLGWVYYGNAMRADVRVWWARESSSATPNAITLDFAGCADNDTALSPNPSPGGGPQFNNYHVVYLSTVIRLTAVQR